MTREQLEEYRSKKEEITELTYKLQHLGDNDEMVDNDVIMDYRSGYPVPQSVVGVDWHKYDNAKARYEQRLKKLQKECDEVEEFVESIEDSLTRRICRMIYLEGLSQKETGEAVHMDRSRVSRKLKKFLTDSEGRKE